MQNQTLSLFVTLKNYQRYILNQFKVISLRLYFIVFINLRDHVK